MTSPLFASLAGYRRDWMVVNGSLSKTAVNGGAGARSQASGLVVTGLTIVTLLLLTGLFEDLPEATLAAVVIAAVIELVDFGALADLWRATTTQLGRIYGVAARPDLIAAVAAMLGVLVFDTLPGLFIGVAISFVLLVYRTSRPNVAVLGREPNMGVFVDMARDPRAAAVPGVVVLRPESGLYFANADAIRHRVLDEVERTGASAVVLDAQTVPVHRRDGGADARRAGRRPRSARGAPRPGPRRGAGARPAVPGEIGAPGAHVADGPGRRYGADPEQLTPLACVG
jgi:MFS superfamily sulfate permease-like transporter